MVLVIKLDGKTYELTDKEVDSMKYFEETLIIDSKTDVKTILFRLTFTILIRKLLKRSSLFSKPTTTTSKSHPKSKAQFLRKPLVQR
jgi:hypothetical protein